VSSSADKSGDSVCGKSHSRIIVLLQWKKGFMRAVYQKVNSHRPCVILKTWKGKTRVIRRQRSSICFYENLFNHKSDL